MNLNKLLMEQKRLDNAILKNAGLDEYPLEKVKLALLAELGELSNEWQGFKYWKKHKEIDKEKLLDEFADCLHFALSLQNHSKSKIYNYKEIKNAVKIDKAANGAEQKTKLFTDAFEAILYYRPCNKEIDIISPLFTIIALGINLDITEAEMEEAYIKKNKENYRRQAEGY